MSPTSYHLLHPAILNLIFLARVFSRRYPPGYRFAPLASHSRLASQIICEPILLALAPSLAKPSHRDALPALTQRATICSTLRYIIKCGAGNGNRTRTVLSYHGILSPGRLPISPPRLNLSPILATYTFNCLNSISHKNLFVNTLFLKIIDFFCL